jgi:hypothetical protein
MDLSSLIHTQVPEVPFVRNISLPFQLFLSYGRADARTAQIYYRRLSAAGFTVWMDVESIRAGEDWELAIKRALRQSQLVLIFLSKTVVSQEGYLHKEILEAIDIAKRKPPGSVFLIPVMLDDCSVHEHLEPFQRVSLLVDGGWERLVAHIQDYQDKYRASQPATKHPPAGALFRRRRARNL